MSLLLRREKLIKSLEKHKLILLIPHRIATRCIRAAKTAEAKERLVLAAIWTNTEDYSRIWKTQFVEKPKKTAIQFLKGLF